MGYEWIWLYLNSINHLIFAMVKCGVLFQVRTEFWNIIWTSFGFKGLIALRCRKKGLIVIAYLKDAGPN
jgi:hypothetical protein